MERQFKGIWIPAQIWLRMDLTAIDKVLLADIDSFTGNGKLFYKSNATLSRELGVSESTVKRSVKTLSTLHLVELSGNTRKRQNEPSVGSNSTPINKTINSVIKSTNYPFEGDKFKEIWEIWLSERKARRYGRYTEVGEAAALHKLWLESSETLDVAIQMINESIANGWRGIFPLKINKNERDNTKKFDNEEYRDYIDSLN